MPHCASTCQPEVKLNFAHIKCRKIYQSVQNNKFIKDLDQENVQVELNKNSFQWCTLKILMYEIHKLWILRQP